MWSNALIGLAMFFNSFLITEGSIDITHSGLDMLGGCEDLIAFYLDLVDPHSQDTTRITTPFYRFDCKERTVTFSRLPYGVYWLHLVPFDDSGNVNPLGMDVGFIIRAGYDSSFTIIRHDSLLVFNRVLPNNMRNIKSFVEIAWVTDGILGEWTNIGPSPVSIGYIPKNVVHVRMNGYLDVWSIPEQRRKILWFPTLKRIVQLEPFWSSELRRSE